MFSFACVSAAVCMAASLALAASPKMLAVTGITNTPGSVQIVRNDVAIQNPNFLGYIDTDGTDYPLEFGYCYQLAFAALTWDGTDLQEVRSVSFAKYSLGNVSNLNEPFPDLYVPTYTLYTPASNYYYCRNYLGVRVDFLTFGKAANYSSSYGVDSYNSGYPYYEGLYQPTTSGPYYMGADLTSQMLMDYLASYVVAVANNDYTSLAYNQGFDAGKDAGYNGGYSAGYADASHATGGGLFTSLFGALVNVPISVVNGLSPLAIWDVPIISLILTFVAIGAVMFLVKKVI